MGDSKPSGGGTGFLFGNIDRRGRLDEDYMEDEAKDQLDNVGTAVRGGDEGMKAVVDAVPKRSGDSDDDDETQVHGEGAQDFYDEDEVMELDARERELFAKKALETQGEDEEEDYDEDEDDGEVKVKPMGNVPLLKKFVAGEPGTLKPPPPVPVEATGEERMQAELMEEARRKAALVANGGGEETPVAAAAAPPGAASDKPLRFSEVLQRPRRLIPKRARPRRFGVIKDAVSATPAAADDDALLFDSTPLLPGVDPTSIFLHSDAAALARKGGERGSPAVRTGGSASTRLNIGGDGDGDSDDDRGGGGAPLDPNCGAESDDLLLGGGEGGGDAEGDGDNRHSLLQQVAWEADIAWEGDTGESDDSGSSEIDDDVDDGDAPPTASASKGVAKVAAGNGHDGGGGDGAEDDSDDDDDMEWEDGGATAAASPAAGSSGADAGPAKSTAGPEKLASSSPVSKADGDGTAASGANGAVSAESAVKTWVEAKAADATLKKPPQLDLGILVTSVIASNKDLADGRWLKDVDWDSSDCESDASDMTPFTLDISKASPRTTRRLILNLNDRQMCLEEVKTPVVEFDTANGVVAGMQAMTVSVEGRRLAPLTTVKPVLDVFDVSNDPYYAPDMGGSMLKVDRRAILRGMRNAPPAVKAQTSIPCVPELYLESFHRPRLLLSPKSKLSRKLEPIRRKRPKGGITQIAGQVPKKENDLLTSGKDAYRVCLSEYALEASPTLIPIPGMASKLVTYQRKDSAAAATQARRDATGTPDADTIFLSPEEVPPVHAGDLTPKDPPLLVLESHIFSAPCTRGKALETDFLIIRRKDKMFVRTIDSTLSVGVTEPKLEVMAPNSERFKKFARDRVSLWLLREFTKSDKDKRGEIQKTAKGEAFIERDHLFKTFDRKRTFPETSLNKLLKELSRYQNQKYVLIPEPPKGFAAMEAELLRTVSPEETCAFEAMESGWYNLIGSGVRKLTHPSQANVRAAAEKTGLAAGPAVGAFIWSQLLRVPWYKSQVMIAAQRQQKKELIQVLSSARIANDLREGGTVMENRVASLTSAEAANVLVNQYRVQTRKIPQELEARKAMVLELATKKSRGMDAVDYQTVIAGVIEKQRNIGSNRTAAGAGVTAAVAAGGFMVIPLEDQLAALERGDVSRLPREVNRATPQDEPSSSPKASSGGAHGRSKAEASSRHGKSGGPSPNPNRSGGGAKPGLKISAGANGTRENKAVPDSDAGKKNSTLEAAGSTAGGPGKVVKKKVKKTYNSIKLTKKVKNADGTTSKVVETITDPERIEYWKNKRSNANSGGANKKAGGDAPATSKPSLKLNINFRKLSETGGNKAPVKKKAVSGSSDRKRGTSSTDAASSSFKKKKSSSSASPAAAGVQKLGHKGSLGKITINQKAVREAQERKAAKRKRSQSYEGDDLDNPMRKAAKKGSTSRRKRNGAVTLNGILGEIETKVRASEGYIVTFEPEIRIARVKPGVNLPEGRVPTSLTTPKHTALDLTKSVESKSYKDLVKKQMYFDLIRRNCQQTKYKSAADFLDDFALMVRNAQAFNQSREVKWVIQHTQLLEEIARECVADSRAEIDAAESILKEEMKPSRVEA